MIPPFSATCLDAVVHREKNEMDGDGETGTKKRKKRKSFKIQKPQQQQPTERSTHPRTTMPFMSALITQSFTKNQYRTLCNIHGISSSPPVFLLTIDPIIGILL
jgi:hypothetical protein